MSRAATGFSWVVEQFARETRWTAVTKPFMSQEEAEAELPGWQSQDAPVRVGEASDYPNQRTYANII